MQSFLWLQATNHQIRRKKTATILRCPNLDLLNLARSCGQTISSDFAQVVTITFAMVVAIYYFLHQAGIRMKVFAFTVYTIGLLAYLGMMLMESNVGVGAVEALRAIPPAAQGRPTQYYLGVKGSWVGLTASVMLNLVLWILWLGTGYLLFFWKKPADVAPPQNARSTGMAQFRKSAALCSGAIAVRVQPDGFAIAR